MEENQYKEQHCKRKVFFDPLERNDLADIVWWQKQFEYLEENYGVVTHSLHFS